MELHAVRTWYDQRYGVVEMDGDVLGIVQQVHALGQGRLRVFYNPQSDGYDIVEKCLDHTERLVFSVDALDQRVVNRLFEADHWGSENPDHRHMHRPAEDDYASRVDRHNEQVLAEAEEESRDRLREHGERLAWALEEDGKGVHASIHVPRGVNREHDPGAS